MRHVERARPHHQPLEEDRVYPPPQFIVPLRDVQQQEGGKVHYEARIEPVGDPTMRVEWFLNGKMIVASEFNLFKNKSLKKIYKNFSLKFRFTR